MKQHKYIIDSVSKSFWTATPLYTIMFRQLTGVGGDIHYGNL